MKRKEAEQIIKGLNEREKEKQRDFLRGMEQERKKLQAEAGAAADRMK